MTMFRLYLVNKVKEAEDKKKSPKTKSSLDGRDRRKYERFSMKEQKIPLSNKDDILMINDISKEGMSLQVNERTFERLSVGDKYQCNIRYLSEKFPCTIEVRWKENLLVGMKIQDPDPMLEKFIQRLIIPQQLGRSMKKVSEEKALKNFDKPLDWYMGTKDTHIVFSHEVPPEFWLVKTQKYILCFKEKTFMASIDEDELNPLTVNRFLREESNIELIEALDSHLLLAKDLIIASTLKESEKDALLETIENSKNSEVRLFPGKS